jgi:hypothetical protein
MENQGGQEAGYCSKMVSDRDDQCLFAFYCNFDAFFQANFLLPTTFKGLFFSFSDECGVAK